jgi:hypothetical protein
MNRSLFQDCLPFAHYNESCAESVQCEKGFGNYSTCHENKCECKSNFKRITLSGTPSCVREFHYGDKCTNHHECVSYMEEPSMICVDEKCVCRENYELYDMYSYKCVKSQSSSSLNLGSSVAVITLLLVPFLIFQMNCFNYK